MSSKGRLQLVLHVDDSTPTLHIYAGVEGLRRLQVLFGQLAADPSMEIDLAALTGVESELLDSMVLSQVETKDDFVQAVSVDRDREGKVTVQWRCGPSGWEWCAELVPPLLKAQINHFQYLTQSAADDVEIELEYKDGLDSTDA